MNSYADIESFHATDGRTRGCRGRFRVRRTRARANAPFESGELLHELLGARFEAVERAIGHCVDCAAAAREQVGQFVETRACNNHSNCFQSNRCFSMNNCSAVYQEMNVRDSAS